MKEFRYMFFDTELSGCEQLVSMGYVCTDGSGLELSADYYIVAPYKPIRKSTVAIHGITTKQARAEGISLKHALGRYNHAVKACQVLVGYAPHNDLLAIAIASKHLKQEPVFANGRSVLVDLARMGADYMVQAGLCTKGQTPSLAALYAALFDGASYNEHNALDDARATARCFWKLMELGWFTFKAIIPYHTVSSLCTREQP